MKAVILAGGLGSRLSEETTIKPKPLVEVGGRPLLWHIMKIYSAHGINDFVVCLGYKGFLIKEYFAHYFLHMSDVTFNMQDGEMEVHHKHSEPWSVTLVDTGTETNTGGRLKRVFDYVGEEDFCFTYGDGVGDVNINTIIDQHKKSGRLGTVTAVQPPGRYGVIEHQGNLVTQFTEKPENEIGWINGGFFVLSPKVFEYLEGDKTIWERKPMCDLAKDGQMGVYFHKGFWQAMDTLREKHILEELWQTGRAPWKIWE
jgi:glucose-1-phosphate cytidylyltransferase